MSLDLSGKRRVAVWLTRVVIAGILTRSDTSAIPPPATRPSPKIAGSNQPAQPIPFCLVPFLRSAYTFVCSCCNEYF